ncbi:MAG: AMP-binding protein [Gammaproteobacteria bacterium]|nr:AMP-binding protein [Gammaproteobacteria bacterium]
MEQSLDIEDQLLSITRQLLVDLEHQRALNIVSMSADLQRELGIGSVEKAELLHRTEQAFNITLPEILLTEAVSLQDLAVAIKKANPSLKPSTGAHVPHLKASVINPQSATTLVDLLYQYGTQEPNRPHIYLHDSHGEESIISYGKLLESATAVAQGLMHRGLSPQQTVAIMLPTSSDFFSAFFGILLAGGIPVPIYPPFRANLIEEYIKHETKILTNAMAHTLITFPTVSTLSNVLRQYVTCLNDVTTVSELSTNQDLLPLPSLNNQQLALIQYTSGSTGDPKGVQLTHANLLNNIRCIGKVLNIQPTDVVVSWLPLYHDMGLIGTWLGSLYYGVPITIMSPITFLTHPEKWLWAIHYHRATISAAPNFAYELCLSKINEKKLAGLDLSSWRFAFNGAEAIYPRTIERFIKKFTPYGFKATSLAPVYGLAENSVALTIPDLGKEPKIDRVDRVTMDETNIAKPALSNTKKFHEFVSCGKPIPDHKIRIVDDTDIELPERNVGHLQFQGPSAMQGYFQNLTATEAAFHNGWWSTGDLGYIADGNLYITGRAKDLIIKSGRNIYPQEVEDIVEQVPGVRKGRVIAFGTADKRKGTEKLIIVAETHEKNKETQDSIQAAIIERVAITIGIPPDEVITAPPETISKTSSGKLQRNACKKAYEQGRLIHKHTPIVMQMSKLFVVIAVKKCLGYLTTVAKLIYTTYLSAVMAVFIPPLWLLITILPYRANSLAIKYWAKLIFLLLGCPIKVDGKKFLKQNQAMIYVSNHASYVDSLLLIAALPAGVRFVGKKEILSASLLRSFVKHLRYLTVDRLDFVNSLQDMGHIKSALDEKNSILIFPEGTFSSSIGLLPFKLGAFKLAAETQIPLCPIALRGTRTMLTGSNKLFSPSFLRIWVGEPIMPESEEFNEAIRLRTIIKQQISEHCGEGTLHLVRAGVQS